MNLLINAKTLWNLTMGFAILVYTMGLFVTIMEPDAATYAIISMEMLDRNNFFELYSRGMDWLDKPHFQFWITAVSYKVFGVNNIGFKIPAILFTLLGVRFTFMYGRDFYSPKVGWISAFLLVTSLHVILSNNDIRAEPYLLGMTIFSMYYFAKFLKIRNWIHFFLGCLGLAGLMMTKGLFTIIPVCSAILFSLIYSRKWDLLFHWQWIVAGVVTMLLTSPVLYSYYVQFDLHPEKVVFGQTNVSGVRFFLWDSQWGRFMNTGPIKGKGDIFFFLHTLLWAFAPWAFLAYFSLYDKTRRLIKRINTSETLTFFGFISLVIILSVSSFQLPHYIVPLFPLLSILTAGTLVDYSRRKKFLAIFNRIHFISLILLLGAVVLLNQFFTGDFPSVDTMLITTIVLIVIGLIYTKSFSSVKKVLFPVAISTLLVMYYMNRDFYPKLMKYQSESELAFYVLDNGIPADQLVCLNRSEWVTDFYLHRVIPVYNHKDLIKSKFSNKFVFCDDTGIESLQKSGIEYEIIETFYDFHVTTMNEKFINRNTRDSTLIQTYLVKVK